jgi:hypothetical protein
VIRASAAGTVVGQHGRKGGELLFDEATVSFCRAFTRPAGFKDHSGALTHHPGTHHLTVDVDQLPRRPIHASNRSPRSAVTLSAFACISRNEADQFLSRCSRLSEGDCGADGRDPGDAQ